MSKPDRSEYEARIQQAAEDFFHLNKDDEACYAARDAKKGQLWIVLWNYYKVLYSRRETDGERIYSVYSGVINECIGKCIEGYKPDAGKPFLHYINATVKYEIARERKKTKLKGLKIPLKISQLWNNIISLAQARGYDASDTEKLFQIGKLLRKSEKEIRQAIDFGLTNITPDISVINGTEISALASCKSDIGNPECDYESLLEIQERIKQFTVINECFKVKQERIKPYLSALLTREFYPALDSLVKMSGTQVDFLFVDAVLFDELRDVCATGEKFPSQQEIAARFKRDKTDASRMLNTFLKEIRKKVSTL
jgi:hypothetical protein